MAHHFRQSRTDTDVLKQLSSVEHLLSKTNAECKTSRQLLDSRVPHLAQDIVTTCEYGYREGKAVQWMKSPLCSGQLPKALASILSKLLPALQVPETCDAKYYWCTKRVNNALDGLLVLCTLSAPPMALRLSIAKQLQQAELLQPLSVAMAQLATAVSAQVAQAASKPDAAFVPPSGYNTDVLRRLGCHVTNENLVTVLARQLAIHLLQTAVRLCSLWPGGVCKSATASPLLPAAAKLGAALAQLSIMLHKQEPDAVDTRNSLAAAVSTACLLVDPRIHTGQESAPAAEVNTSLGHPSYNSTPAFRLLLKLAVPALAALLLNQVNGQDQHQQQGHHAVQQLWSALEYAPNQLPAAITALRECGPSVELCAASAESLPVMYNLKKLIRALGCSWGQLTQDDLASVASASNTSILQQLCQESRQVLLLMSIAKYMFLHGPLGLQGDIDLLVATVRCFQSYFIAATAAYDNMAERGESPSAVFPIDKILRLLLQYLQYSRGALLQQQQQQATADPGSSSSMNRKDSSKLYILQRVVLTVIQRMTFFTFTSRYGADPSLQQSWLVWSQYIAQFLDQMLRSTVRAADDDVEALSRLYNEFGPCPDTWLRIMFNHTAAWEWSCHNVSSCSNLASNSSGSSSKDVQPESSNTATAAVANASCPDSQGSAVRNHQAGPNPLNLQLFSLMTSFCKGLTQTAALGHGLSALLIRRQQHADCLVSTAAQALHQTAQQVHHPAVRPWLSLVGRCLVMMGQRLKHLDEEFVQQCRYCIAQDMLQDHRKGLSIMQQSCSELLQQQQQVEQLQEAVQQCSDEVETLRKQLAAAKAQKGKQQLFRSLQPKLQKHIGKLREAEKALEAAMQELRNIEDQQQEVQQQAKKLEAQLQLCTSVNSRMHIQLVCEVRESMRPLLCVAKVLSQHLLKHRQQQQQTASADSGTTATAGSIAALSSVEQQLRHELLPTLVVLLGLCDLAVTGSTDWDDVVNEGAGVLAADIWAQQYDSVQQDESLEWLQELCPEEQLRSALEAATPVAVQLIALIRKGLAAGYSANVQVPAMTLPVLLSSEPYQQLQQQLVVMGSKLVTALPHCWCCNNPGCDNLSADSELQLISGKQRICAGCTGGSTDKDINSTAARYCSVECQKQHWKQHRKVCRRLHKQDKQQQ